jgi:CrcB protein
MQLVALAAIGGAIGSALRYLVGLAFVTRFGPAYPWATLTVNVVGCFAMGMIVETIARRFGTSDTLRTFLMTGVLGGFTTFSAFALDFSALTARSGAISGLVYVIASVVASILALYAGLALARWAMP